MDPPAHRRNGHEAAVSHHKLEVAELRATGLMALRTIAEAYCHDRLFPITNKPMSPTPLSADIDAVREAFTATA